MMINHTFGVLLVCCTLLLQCAGNGDLVDAVSGAADSKDMADRPSDISGGDGVVELVEVVLPPDHFSPDLSVATEDLADSSGDISDALDFVETTADHFEAVDSGPEVVDVIDAFTEIVDALDSSDGLDGTLDTPDVCIPDCDGKECGSDGCGGSCGECTKPCCEKCTGTGKCYTYALPCVPGELGNCTGKACGDDGCGNSCGECPWNMKCEDDQCVVLPPMLTASLTIVDPATHSYFDQTEPSTPITVSVVVTNWSPYPAAGKSVICLLDGNEVGATDTNVLVFPDVPFGMHFLTCRVALNGIPLTNCAATSTIVVKVKKPCNGGGDAACDDDNPCSIDACTFGSSGEWLCHYGLDLQKPYCCISSFNCDCSTNWDSDDTWKSCSKEFPICSDCGTPGDDPLCDDNNPCTIDSCKANGDYLGCVNTWIYTDEGKCCSAELADPDGACDDGIYVTVDKCNLATGVCETGPTCYDEPTACSDDDECTVDKCDDFSQGHWFCSHTVLDWCSM
jgi:hypothetical protein